ncbi:MAG: glycosyltransferase [Candidatus Thermoplasmatota archaeon]|jgi:glycosyltransferase involved in cell wall biosynthesis|nr:glycosyltransferase [Candidatus Thermoplasmatota archaeon]MCL5987402.1 glycosyltransferase [Candidatus Thermoplasmatota archaeon]
MNKEKVDIVITVLNEGKNLRNLLNSIISQDSHCGIVVVDAGSTDNTLDILKEFEPKGVKYTIRKCTRGEGRNIGVSMSSADCILFTDGDAIPSNDWASCMVSTLRDNDLVWGLTETSGSGNYATMKRVKLFYHDHEITLPSMNMGVRREMFLKVGGFDTSLITAEDIDLNIRLLRSGARAYFCSDCRVTHNARESLRGLMKQAFWNGYGRSQLKRKNSGIWKEIEKDYFSLKDVNFHWIIRIAAAVMGYMAFAIHPVNSHHS